jgi:predicted Zn-dependent protease
MTLLGRDEALALARRVIDASEADETEVTVDTTRDVFVRFADVGPTQSADRERGDVSIRVRLASDAGWREARVTTGSGSEDGWRAALARALELAGAAPADPAALPLPGAAEVPASAPDEPTLAHPMERKAAAVQAALAACGEHDLRPAGLVRTCVSSRAIANSAGRAVHGWHNRAAFALTASGADGSGYGSALAPGVEQLDVERATRRAVGRAVAAQDPRELDAGEYAVVLEPPAVSSLLLFASYRGFGAREVEEQASFLCGRIGEAIFPERLSIRDDVRNATLPGLPFDGEGTPKEAVVLVDRGVPRDPVTDRAHARRMGLPCTGHARQQPSAAGPAATNLVVAPGDAGPDQLVAGIERGLLVSQFHYTNLIEPRELLLTGMTRNGTFLVEDGEVVGPVRNLRFTDSLVRALSRVAAVGSEAEAAGALFEGEVVTPALRIDGFRFTSTTEF